MIWVEFNHAASLTLSGAPAQPLLRGRQMPNRPKQREIHFIQHVCGPIENL
jgi:hypothetical protein